MYVLHSRATKSWELLSKSLNVGWYVICFCYGRKMTKLDLLIFSVSLFAMSQRDTYANSLLKVFSKFLRLLSMWSKLVSSAKLKKTKKNKSIWRVAYITYVDAQDGSLWHAT